MVKFIARLPMTRTDKPMCSNFDGRIFYRHDRKVEPYVNPQVEKMHKLLKKQKVQYNETSDGEFIIFASI